ncbi:DUF1853 family protein [Gramella sp. GC03-9]|uniref:DUF1853 family protein n=1 Tax=Christiangramia oceanisediminis TaxID=2920386 RepID=A0A9X2KYN7_9FLAO|nr:DUF1853 family protein [Gramella oceanisediminis]MCP9200631.1 DUF1853 family protein [Gramella oceanisediminis]
MANIDHVGQPGFSEQFRGFLNTQDICEKLELDEFSTFKFPEIKFTKDLEDDLKALQHPRNSVLGKRMESFFSIAIKHSDRYRMLASNIQIIEEKQTLGELDFLVYDNMLRKPLHVELVYKLYVYDASFNHELERWIGPNRRDSFSKKLDKLRSRQFPLLFKPETQRYLQDHDLKPGDIDQQLCFKAQLYLPKKKKLEYTNADAKSFDGSWLGLDEFRDMDWKRHLFFSPKKKLWSSDPAFNSSWKTYSEIIHEIESFLDKNKSPLIWMKTKTSYIRFFIVWW